MCSVTAAGNMCCLQSLGLGGNEIHDEGASHLALALRANRRLRSLGLGGNKICECVGCCDCSFSNYKSHAAADEGGRALAEMLGHNQTLKKLLLSSNLLGIRYPYIEALYCYLSTSPSC